MFQRKTSLLYTLILGLFFTGCSTIPHREESYSVFGFDFTPYIANQFFFSTTEFNGKYITLGTLDIYYYSNVIPITESDYLKKTKADEEEYSYFHNGSFFFKEKKYSTSKLLDLMYQESLKLGANGVMDFKLLFEFDPDYNLMKPRLTGVAIKIDDLD